MKLRKFSGQFRVRIPKGLHMELVKDAKLQGVSLNTYIIYLLSMDDALERILLESGALDISELIKFYKDNFKGLNRREEKRSPPMMKDNK